MNPDHLRTAIERIGVEKPSDYTLVMEEVGRMEAEERSDETLIEVAGLSEPPECIGAWRMSDGGIAVGGYHFGPSGEPFLLIPPDERFSTLLHAASLFIEEAERMGWGETSETALPGSFDLLRKAVDEVRG